MFQNIDQCTSGKKSDLHLTLEWSAHEPQLQSVSLPNKTNWQQKKVINDKEEQEEWHTQNKNRNTIFKRYKNIQRKRKLLSKYNTTVNVKIYPERTGVLKGNKTKESATSLYGKKLKKNMPKAWFLAH